MFKHPEWSYSTNIYEVNVRQYTEEGTFQAFSKHLPRLREMGVEILWFMPVTPISETDRKGTLGSYYAVKDYTAVNPEFGTIEDFVQLVQVAHEMDFKVIIDWVANHTGNDHQWLTDHPEYYQHDEKNIIVHPNEWSDVSHLNYGVEGTRVAMIDAMKYWVSTCNIDGFRCDMAHLVPIDFWFRARLEIETVKPRLFFLAECDEPVYHNAFDASYTWTWMHATQKMYRREITAVALREVLKTTATTFHPDALRVYFTSNHDENSWNGTEYEKYREIALPLAVFSCTWNGIPMIYSGQELPNFKRLKFFEKDLINWVEQPKLHDFYRRLLTIKKNNPALLAGSSGSTEWITLPEDQNVFAYKRKYQNEEVVVVLNFSSGRIFIPVVISGKYQDVLKDQIIDFNADDLVVLDSYGYKVLQKL